MIRDEGEEARTRLKAMCRERLEAAENVAAHLQELQRAIERYLSVCRDMEAMGYDSDVLFADLCAPSAEPYDPTGWTSDDFLEAERQRIEELKTALHEMSRSRGRRGKPRADVALR